TTEPRSAADRSCVRRPWQPERSPTSGPRPSRDRGTAGRSTRTPPATPRRTARAARDERRVGGPLRRSHSYRRHGGRNSDGAVAKKKLVPVHRGPVWVAFAQDLRLATRPAAHAHQKLDRGARRVAGRLEGEVRERRPGVGPPGQCLDPGADAGP